MVRARELADDSSTERLVEERQDDAKRDTDCECEPTQPGNLAVMNAAELVRPIDGADP